jgi:hypothetical protein
MNKAAQETAAASAAALLTHYSFDRSGYSTDELIAEWLLEYPAAWVRLATIEALYQGRYKAVSVTHILACWKRRNQALYHFNHEFERLVSSQLPKGWKGILDSTEEIASGDEFIEVPPPGGFPRAIPSLKSGHISQTPGGEHSPESDAPDTPAIASPPEPSIPGDSEPVDSSPPEPHEPDSSCPEPSPPVPGDSFPESLNPEVKETVKTVIPEKMTPVSLEPAVPGAIELNTDDLLGDLWLDHPGIQSQDLEAEDSFQAIVNNSPIHQFTPQETSSDFYSKLKAVAQRQPQSPPKS